MQLRIIIMHSVSLLSGLDWLVSCCDILGIVPIIDSNVTGLHFGKQIKGLNFFPISSMNFPQV